MDESSATLGRDAKSGLVFLSRPALGRRTAVQDIASASTASAPRPYTSGGIAKRVFDVFASGLALLFALPLLVSVCLLVKLTSKGPVLFWSARDDGRGGTFPMPKFRTMRVGAPVQPREQLADAPSCMTPPGEILRKTSIDELPQLIPVLMGKMSLVGPRPLLPGDPTVQKRLLFARDALAKPGLTGLAQINGRNNLTPREKARYDQFYAQHWSWGLDLWILWRTVQVVLSRSGVL